MSKILLISPSFPPETGGVEHLMRDIAEHSSHKIEVLTKTAEDFDDSRLSFNVIRKDFSGYTGLIQKIWFITRKSKDYDKIYLAGAGESWMSIPARLLGTEIVSHAHGTELFIKIYRLRTYLRKLLFFSGIRFISEFISISDWTSNKLRELEIEEEKINQIPNGIDFEKFNGAQASEDVSKNEFTLLTVSRLHSRKGHEFVLKAIQDIECHYVIVGDGEYREELEELAHELGVESKVSFLGYVEEKKLPNYYQAADLYVMPSKFMENIGNVESFGISYIEANAAGLPAIGSNTGGVPTAIRDGYNGLLCEPNSESVKELILKLKKNEELREKMSKNAVKWAEKHDWSNIIERIDNVLAK